MTGVIMVLVADDHPMLRSGISAVVAAEEDMMVVGEACDGADAVAQFDVLRPDVTLMDLQMPRMSGLEAMKVLTQNKFHLIITDINMPDINGLEVVRFVREKSPAHKETPLIIISTDGRDVDRERGMKLGADDLIGRARRFLGLPATPTSH